MKKKGLVGKSNKPKKTVSFSNEVEVKHVKDDEFDYRSMNISSGEPEELNSSYHRLGNDTAPLTIEEEQCKFIAQTFAKISADCIVAKLSVHRAQSKPNKKNLATYDLIYENLETKEDKSSSLSDFRVLNENTTRNTTKDIRDDKEMKKKISSDSLKSLEERFSDLALSQEDDLTKKFYQEMKSNMKEVVEEIFKESEKNISHYLSHSPMQGNKVRYFEDQYKELYQEINASVKKKSTKAKLYSGLARFCDSVGLKKSSRSCRMKSSDIHSKMVLKKYKTIYNKVLNKIPKVQQSIIGR